VSFVPCLISQVVIKKFDLDLRFAYWIKMMIANSSLVLEKNTVNIVFSKIWLLFLVSDKQLF